MEIFISLAKVTYIFKQSHKKGFEIIGVVEPKPEENMLNTAPEILDELRRPMMLLVSARKK